MADPRAWRTDDVARLAPLLAGAVAGAAETTDAAVRYRLTASADNLAAEIARSAAAIAGGEYRPQYNGWTNRETWNTHLWLSNDQYTDTAAREIVAAVMADPATDYPDDADQDRAVRLWNAADALREWWTEEAGPDGASPLSDAWTYAMAVTDWREIADAYAEGLTDAGLDVIP